MFDGIKKKAQSFAVKKMLKKQGLPPEQQQMIEAMIEQNPDLFQKMAKEIEQKKKEGKGEMAASMEVMRKYQADLQKLAMKNHMKR